MKRYVIQLYKRKSLYDYTHRWVTLESMQYDTLDEAKAAFARLTIKADCRIAEAYILKHPWTFPAYWWGNLPPKTSSMTCSCTENALPTPWASRRGTPMTGTM